MTREEAINRLQDAKDGYKEYLTDDAIDLAIKALDCESNTWSLEDAREDFVFDVFNTLDFLPTNYEANQIIDSFDRVTSDITQ